MRGRQKKKRWEDNITEWTGLEVADSQRAVDNRFSSFEFSARWYLCARESPYALHHVSHEFPQCCISKSSNVGLMMFDNGPFSSSQGRSLSASLFYASPLQAITCVMSLALCPQVVSQAPQHFRSSETQAACEGCFARQSICSVISFESRKGWRELVAKSSVVPQGCVRVTGKVQ